MKQRGKQEVRGERKSWETVDGVRMPVMQVVMHYRSHFLGVSASISTQYSRRRTCILHSLIIPYFYLLLHHLNLHIPSTPATTYTHLNQHTHISLQHTPLHHHHHQFYPPTTTTVSINPSIHELINLCLHHLPLTFNIPVQSTTKQWAPPYVYTGTHDKKKHAF